MNLTPTLVNPFKKQSYVLATALVVAACIGFYLLILLPRQTAQTDARNMEVFIGIQNQFKGFIEDKVKKIDNKKNIHIDEKIAKLEKGPPINDFVVDTIRITGAEKDSTIENHILIYRQIPFSGDDQIREVNDSVSINLREFIKKISSMTSFTSFYICEVNDKDGDALLAVNTPLQDQDSIRKYLRHPWPSKAGITSNRYYGNQITVGKLKLFMAAGLAENQFQSAARSVSPPLLIFALLVIILLFLSISFVKPVLSSRDERVEQRDLVKVVFAVGALCAVLMVFGMVSGWNNAIKHSNHSDLKHLAKTVEEQFLMQFDEYKLASQKVYTVGMQGNPFKKFSLDLVGSDTTDAFELADMSEEYGKYLHNYFLIDKDGIVTMDINKEMPGLRRKYSDRDYFKLIKNDSLKETNQAVLRSVLSRENNLYQWIYVERDPEAGGFIRGFAFQDIVTNVINIPPDTDYMLVDGGGNVLLQSDPGQNINQNLLRGAGNQADLQNLLSGRYSGQFYMDYQGTNYQVYGTRLGVKSEIPIYIVATREQTFNSNLALFTFCNGVIIALLYGIFLLGLTFLYSVLLTTGRLKVLSKAHFHYLFPDGSKSGEYRKLTWYNCVSALIVIGSLLFMNAPAALVVSVITGCCAALLNFLVLKTKWGSQHHLRLAFALAGLAILCFVLIYNEAKLYSVMLLFSVQAVIVLVVRHIQDKLQKRTCKEVENAAQNDEPATASVKKAQIVNRPAYIKFMTMMLSNHFILFPFILVCSIYVSELNDYSTWHCSAAADSERECFISSYGCNCEAEETNYSFRYETLARSADIGLFNRPGTLELSKFSFEKLKKGAYITVHHFFIRANLLLFIVGTAFLIVLIYILTNFYSGRFFFYELMVAMQKGYFPAAGENKLESRLYTTSKSDDDPELIIDLPNNYPHAEKRKSRVDLGATVMAMEENMLQPTIISGFVQSVNLQQLEVVYEKDWNDVPDHLRFVLFDFARDNFINYKNKGALMRLMDLQYIVQDQVTGLLMLRNPNFQKYLLTKVKNDKKFIADFNLEGTGGFYSKLRLPIIIIAVSLLLLMLYLNKDNYDRLLVFSGGITGALALVNQLLALQKKA